MKPWTAEVPLPEGWPDCPPYLYGIDLFNRAYLWEAHESWEEIWHGVGRDSVPGHFVQGLIQVSAGLLRAHLGTPDGARRLLGKAETHLALVPHRPTYMGLRVAPWLSRVSTYLEEREAGFPFLRLEP